jgi:SAM-dependent methyltransferase
MRFLKSVVPRPIKDAIKAAKRALTPHDAIYDKDYYDNKVERPAYAAAPIMARSMFDWKRPETVIDIGCGTGALLAAFRDLGCDVRGLEYSEAGLDYCRSRGLSVQKFNIAKDETAALMKGADLAVSFEVAEHLPERIADRYVRLLCSLSATIVMSAATPGQGGDDHVNEQPHEYWIEKFQANGFSFDRVTVGKLSDEWQKGRIASYYSANVMVFLRK